jgi:hypothetical protein
VRTFSNAFQGRAERAACRPACASTRGSAALAGEETHGDGALGGAGASPQGTRSDRTGSSALAPCGARRAAAGALPRAPPVTGLAAVTARRPRLRGEQPSSQRPSLEPTKITVKSAAACGLRVLRMALRATLDCDLPSVQIGASWKDGKAWSWHESLQPPAGDPPGQATGTHTGEPSVGDRHFPKLAGNETATIYANAQRPGELGAPVPTCPTCNGRCRCPRCDGSGIVPTCARYNPRSPATWNRSRQRVGSASYRHAKTK